jgi:hypothetical protein
MRKDKKLIPKGLYCYTFKNGKRAVCPYWSTDKVHTIYQENGYCEYLGKGDWDLNEEYNKEGGVKGWDGKGNPLPPADAHELTMGLLWDMCKECNINDDENFERKKNEKGI